MNLISLKERLDTTTATGKQMLTMMAALSQFERDIITERTKDGLTAARARGRMGGRPKAEDAAVQKAMKLYDAEKLSIREISEATGISSSTINRRIAKGRKCSGDPCKSDAFTI